MKRIFSVELPNKRVLLRADCNVPIKNGEVADDFRLRAIIPTINYLREADARIILICHLGRPEGKPHDKYSLRPVASRLEKLLGFPVTFVDDIVGKEAVKAAQDVGMGQVLMLQNLRFDPKEEANDPEFAKALAALADIYVTDAFAVLHRAHASIVGVPKFLPSYSGLLLEKELEVLDRVRTRPVHPFVILMGGAKVQTKIHIIREFMGKADSICLGGIIANTILAAKGATIGRSLYEKNMDEYVKDLQLTDIRLHVPIDVVVSPDTTGKGDIRTAAVGNMNKDEMILDIGPDTVRLFQKIMSEANTIVWNGPMGLFEVEAFARGTIKLAKFLKRTRAYTVVGGGDVIRAVEEAGLQDSVDFISTGGGAMLEYLAGESLPGLEALQ